jgi:glycosyltransferase involved in cell wall biosynthesis
VRILEVTGRSDHGGGPEHVLQLVQGLRSRDAVWVACPRQGIYWSRFAAEVGNDRLFAIAHRRLDPMTVTRLVDFVFEQGIEVIHSHGVAGGILARLVAERAGIPCVHTFHGVPPSGTWKRLLYRWLEPQLVRSTALAIAVSRSEAAEVLAAYPWYHGRLVISENAVSAADGVPQATPDPKRLVMFARNNRQKHPELVIPILQALAGSGWHGHHLDMYGEGLLQAPWYRAALAAGVPVSCHAPTDQPAAILANSGVYLSTARWEGMPLALLEAFRTGLPVVASDASGNRDVVTHEVTGLLYPEGDATAAAQCLVRLQEDPALMQRLVARARQECTERFGRPAMVERVRACYQRVVRGTAGATDDDSGFREPGIGDSQTVTDRHTAP